jgi:hypothetical protein
MITEDALISPMFGKGPFDWLYSYRKLENHSIDGWWRMPKLRCLPSSYETYETYPATLEPTLRAMPVSAADRRSLDSPPHDLSTIVL